MRFVILSFIFTCATLAAMNSTGIRENVSKRSVGIPHNIVKADDKWFQDLVEELSSDYITAVDIDPKVFDFNPDDHEESADFASIKFISKLIRANQSRDVALNEPGRRPADPEYRFENMYYIPGEKVSVKGSMRDYDRMPVSTIERNGVTVIANYPRENVLPTIENPVFNSTIRGFYIDKKAVTNREYREFVQATGHRSPPHWPEDDELTIELKDEPVVDVSHDDAAKYAAWAGKRLPSYSEYERAQKRYPYLRVNAPLREWTSTIANPGRYPAEYYIFGGRTLLNEKLDQNTGFRCAIDDR